LTGHLVWFRPDQIGVYNRSFFDSPEFEQTYQDLTVETDPAKRKALCNVMEDLMEASGGFIFLCLGPFLAIHDADLVPVILADGHPDPVTFRRNPDLPPPMP
jgi:peptide/nickel transport system substrate-binding protein